MKTNQQGFIALFFTLSISSILLTYVALSSQTLFDFVHSREKFIKSKTPLLNTLQCGDEIIDIIVRTLPNLTISPNNCGENDVAITRISPNTVEFSFKINSLLIKGTITRGFISSIQSSYISL